MKNPDSWTRAGLRNIALTTPVRRKPVKRMHWLGYFGFCLVVFWIIVEVLDHWVAS